MAGLTINDFRGAMGEYNLGNLKLVGEGEDQKIALYNNHRVLRNAETNSAENNQAIRTQFATAIETFLKSKGFDVSAGSAAGAFMDEIRRDLLGDGVKTNALSRSADVARILDKLDAAVELKDFDLSRTMGSAKLHERFVLTAGLGKTQPQTETFQLNTESKADIIMSQTLKLVRDTLAMNDSGEFKVDDKLLKVAAKMADISKTRATTYLATRPETVLLKAQSYLQEALGKMKPSEQNELMFGIGKKNLADIAIAKAVEEIHIDTVSARGLSTLSGVRRLSSNMMLGLDAFDAKRLANRNELNGLLSTLSKLASGQITEGKIVLLGQEMTLTKQANGNLNGQLGDIRFEAFGSAKVMLRNIENAIVNGKLSSKDLKSVYANQDYTGANGDAVEGARRVNIIATAIVKDASQLGEIELQVLSKAHLRHVADGIVSGELKTPADIKKKIAEYASARMYSEETLEMVNGYLSAPDKIKNTAVINEPRTDTTPALNKFVSDLFSNGEVWKMDNLSDIPGGRIKDIFLTHKETLVALVTGELKMDSLPQIAGVDVKGLVDDIVAKLKGGGVKDAASLETFVTTNQASLETLEGVIDNAAKTSIDLVQTAFTNKMSEGIEAAKVDTREVWQKSLGEIVDEQKKSAGSAEGQFIEKLMNEYLKRSSINEKRSMMASLVNLTTQNSTDVEKFSAILKGAGPVFQKLLQGFPEDQIPVGMRGVFADMKSHLAPIPDEVVKATLAKIVSESDGKIASISLDKTLGSASVGQAFLCTIRNTDGTSTQAVIKMLKPDVQNRFAREVNLLRDMAGEIGEGMLKTLEGRLSTIKDELNFNVEAENIKSGQVYNKGGAVKSVELYKGVASGMNVLVLTKAEGDTIDNYIANKVDAKLNEVKAGLTFVPGSGFASDMYTAENLGQLQKSHRELTALANDIAQKQTLLIDMAKKWFSEAVFGSGYFHGDMHAGNIMVTDKDITVIDFGNAKKLSGTEVVHLKQLICASAAGDVDTFLDGMDKLLGNSTGGARLKDATVRQELRAFLAEIFNQGGLNETDEKLFIALNAIQNKGIEIPSAVYNYTSSQNRLKNSIAELGAKLDEVKLMIGHCIINPDKVYESSLNGGGTKKIYKEAFSELLPVFDKVKEKIGTGFTASARDEIIKRKRQLTEENRAKVVQTLLSKPEKIQTMLEPALELVAEIGVADQTLGARLASAREALAAAVSADDRKAALTTIVEVLHDIQSQFIADMEKEQEVPEALTMGGAFSDVIEDQIYDKNGNLNWLKAMRFCSDIGGVGIANKLYSKLQVSQDRPANEKRLDDNGYVAAYFQDLDSWYEADIPSFKVLAKEIRFSADITSKLMDADFHFKSDPVARRELVRQLAKNLMSVYIAQARRGFSPLMSYRDSSILLANEKKMSSGQKGVEAYRKRMEAGDPAGMEKITGCFAYITAFQHIVVQPGLFQAIGAEMDGSNEFMTMLKEELRQALTFTDADVEDIVNAQFAQQRDLWLADDPKLSDDQIRDKMRAQVKDDFRLESKFLAEIFVRDMYGCAWMRAKREDEML